MSDFPQNLDIAIAHENPEVQHSLDIAVRSLGYRVVAVCERASELLEVANSFDLNLIITSAVLRDGNAISALIEIGKRRPVPGIIVTEKESLQGVEEALKDHVMAYLVEPIDPIQIRPTIYLVCERFQQFESLKAENEDLKSALAARKLIERAKGILMGRYNLSEAEAFRKLQKMAQSDRTKLANMAQKVLDEQEQSSPSPREGEMTLERY